MIKRVKGFKDIFNEDIKMFQVAERSLKEVAKRFAYEEIITPVLEESELFKRSVGEGTDIVNKEMYTFLDKGGREVTLRPEITASVARCYIENHFETRPLPLKFYYFGPCFRYEKPQKGRFREFYQFGIEALGDESPFLDGEVILVAYTIARELNLKGVEVKINSIGDRNCRPLYRQNLLEAIKPHYDELCDDCKKRFYTNPLRILDCRNESEDFKKNLPRMIDYLCEDCRAHFEKVLDYLEKANIPYEVDHTLVRGLDYYTRTVFEVVSKELGSQNALLGGGRYDYLIEQLGGRPTPGIGFALGVERLIEILKAQEIHTRDDILIYIIFDEKILTYMIEVSQRLRAAGLTVFVDAKDGGFKNQLERSLKRNATFTVFLGENEANTNTIEIKNMQNKVQKNIKIDEVKSYLKEQGYA